MPAVAGFGGGIIGSNNGNQRGVIVSDRDGRAVRGRINGHVFVVSSHDAYGDEFGFFQNVIVDHGNVERLRSLTCCKDDGGRQDSVIGSACCGSRD